MRTVSTAAGVLTKTGGTRTPRDGTDARPSGVMPKRSTTLVSCTSTVKGCDRLTTPPPAGSATPPTKATPWPSAISRCCVSGGRACIGTMLRPSSGSTALPSRVASRLRWILPACTSQATVYGTLRRRSPGSTTLLKEATETSSTTSDSCTTMAAGCPATGPLPPRGFGAPPTSGTTRPSTGLASCTATASECRRISGSPQSGSAGLLPASTPERVSSWVG